MTLINSRFNAVYFLLATVRLFINISIAMNENAQRSNPGNLQFTGLIRLSQLTIKRKWSSINKVIPWMLKRLVRQTPRDY